MYEGHLLREHVDKTRILRTVEVITTYSKAVNYLDEILTVKYVT